MRRLILRLLLACAFATASLGHAAPAALPTVTTSVDAVSIRVTPRSLEGPTWDFDVVLDTHSRELSDDLLRTVVLVGPDGSAIAPLEWRGAAPGGHHRAGLLRFKATEPRPAAIVLRITRPGETASRTYRWQLR